MVTSESISDQLKRIGFNQQAWGRAEVRELPNIILPDERIFECVNGMYEGGFALLVATDVRVLLIDKKPFNYLTVEDLRFDMINEIDYNHRAFGAYVDISTGSRELKFRSYNQPRLRKLITHVQGCMAEIKKKQASHQEGQNQHLEQINEHLQAYLVAQYKHQEELQKRLEEAQRSGAMVNSPAPPRPSPELSDYLLAHGLLRQYQEETDDGLRDDLYDAGRQEIFGDHATEQSGYPVEVNPLRIAYSKLPMALRNRKFGRPSLQAHSQAGAEPVN